MIVIMCAPYFTNGSISFTKVGGVPASVTRSKGYSSSSSGTSVVHFFPSSNTASILTLSPVSFTNRELQSYTASKKTGL